jgi:outer membrane protein W
LAISAASFATLTAALARATASAAAAAITASSFIISVSVAKLVPKSGCTNIKVENRLHHHLYRSLTDYIRNKQTAETTYIQKDCSIIRPNNFVT